MNVRTRRSPWVAWTLCLLLPGLPASALTTLTGTGAVSPFFAPNMTQPDRKLSTLERGVNNPLLLPVDIAGLSNADPVIRFDFFGQRSQLPVRTR